MPSQLRDLALQKNALQALESCKIRGSSCMGGGGGAVLWVEVCPEMVFLDINLTKDLSLLLPAIHSLVALKIL